jgi:hypothetical protein
MFLRLHINCSSDRLELEPPRPKAMFQRRKGHPRPPRERARRLDLAGRQRVATPARRRRVAAYSLRNPRAPREGGAHAAARPAGRRLSPGRRGIGWRGASQTGRPGRAPPTRQGRSGSWRPGQRGRPCRCPCPCHAPRVAPCVARAEELRHVAAGIARSRPGYQTRTGSGRVGPTRRAGDVLGRGVGWPRPPRVAVGAGGAAALARVDAPPPAASSAAAAAAVPSAFLATGHSRPNATQPY